MRSPALSPRPTRATRATGAGHPLAWVLAFVLAALYAWLIPPMQSPDETAHITRAYLISRGQWLLDPPAPEMRALAARYPGIPEVPGFIDRMLQHGGRTGGLVDAALLDYMDAYRAWPGKPFQALPSERSAQLAALRWQGTPVYYVAPNTTYYFPLVYVPQAAGLALGRALDWSVDHSYRAARVLTWACCAALLWLAFGLLRPNPLVAAVLLLPMTVFQLLSPTIDGLTSCLAVYCISLFLHLARQEASPGKARSLALAAGVLLLATTRTHLVVLLAFPLWLAWRRRSGFNLVLATVASVAALAWTLFAMHGANDVLVPRSAEAPELLRYYAARPLAFVQVLGATLTDAPTLAFYRNSFIGVLGALDTPLPALAYPVLAAGLLVCAVASLRWPQSREDAGLRALLLVLALASCVLIFLALLLAWTPHPARLVQGVQGRYFIVPALLVAYALGGPGSQLGRRPEVLQPHWRHQLGAGLTAAFGLAALAALTQALLTRYH